MSCTHKQTHKRTQSVWRGATSTDEVYFRYVRYIKSHLYVHSIIRLYVICLVNAYRRIWLAHSSNDTTTTYKIQQIGTLIVISFFHSDTSCSKIHAIHRVRCRVKIPNESQKKQFNNTVNMERRQSTSMPAEKFVVEQKEKESELTE